MYDRVSGNIPAGHWGGHTTGSGSYPAGDPCRALGAYRTPTHKQWQDITALTKWGAYNNRYGYFAGLDRASCTNTTIASGCIFFPITGERDFSNGILYAETSGYYWSSTVGDNTNSGYNTGFDKTVFNPDGGLFARGNAIAVRCVAE